MATSRSLTDAAEESDHRRALRQQPDSDVAGKPCGSGSLCVQVLSDADQRQPHQQRGQSANSGLSTPTRAMPRSIGISPRRIVSAPAIRRHIRTIRQTNSLLILGNTLHPRADSQCSRYLDSHLQPQHIERSSFWRVLDHSHRPGPTFVPSIGDLGTQLGIANANTAGPGLLLLGFGGGDSAAPGNWNTHQRWQQCRGPELRRHGHPVRRRRDHHSWQARIQDRIPDVAVPAEHLLQRQQRRVRLHPLRWFVQR